MTYLKVYGGNILSGNLEVSGAKNSSLGLIPLATLASEKVTLQNMPNIRDVYVFLALLENIGVPTNWDPKRRVLEIFPSSLTLEEVDVKLAKQTRGSIGLICPLLVKRKKAIIPFPGGDKIGERPLDELIRGIKLMGGEIEYSHGLFTFSRNSDLKGINMTLKYPSHITTMLLITLATSAIGKTILKNIALEPEINDIIILCKKMGVKIIREGSTVTIFGKSDLNGCIFDIMPDRLQIATYIVGTLMTEGTLKFPIYYLDNLKSEIDILVNSGANLFIYGNHAVITGKGPYKTFNLITGPYPMFPTDLQAIFSAFLTKANGKSSIEENVFENRLQHFREFKKIGIETKILSNRKALIVGDSSSRYDNFNCVVEATDIRAGMALVLCGLALGKNSTIYIKNHYHISRGYSDYLNVLRSLGGKVEIVETIEE